MKKNFKRNAVVFLATALVTACGASMALSMPRNQVPASAQTSTDLQMKTGASIYLDETSGIRFGYTVANYDPTADAGKNYGMLIVPYDYLGKAGITAGADVDYVTLLNEAYEDEVLPYAPIVAENITPELKNGEYLVKHSIVEIIENNYTRKFFGIGFEKTGDTYVYATQHENVRSVFEVANIVLNDYAEDSLTADDKQLIEDNKTTVDYYVTTGFDFVYESASFTNSYAGAQAYSPLKLVKKAGKENVDLESQMHWTYRNTDDTVATVDDEGKIHPLQYGTTEVTYSLGGAKEITQEVKILASKAQSMLANNASANADFNSDGSVSLPVSHHYNGTGKDMGKINAEYVAFQGNYGVGTAIDIEFSGNNMPIVKLFADKINGKISTQDGEGETDENAGTAALIMNGSHDTEGGGNLLKPTNNALVVLENLFGNHAMASTTMNRGYYMYGKVVPEFTQTKLMENSAEQQYKYTIALSESSGTKFVEIKFYKMVDTTWTYLNQVACPLSYLGLEYTGTNIVILPGFVGAWDEDMEVRAKNTFKVSEPYSYTQTNAGIYATGTTYVKNADDSYTFTLERLCDNGSLTNVSTNMDNIVFADQEYGIGTYVDIQVPKRSGGALLPTVQLFAQYMKGEWSSSGVYFAARVAREGSSNTYDNYKIFYGETGMAETTKVWMAEGGYTVDTDSYNLLYPQGGDSHKYTVGTYLEGGNVFIEMKLYNVTGSTETILAEKTIDTGVAEADWFAAGAIVITPLPTNSSGAAVPQTYTCKIRQHNQ